MKNPNPGEHSSDKHHENEFVLSEQTEIDMENVKNICETLGHDTRIDIFSILSMRGRMRCADIAKALDKNPQLVHYHLQKLCLGEIVTRVNSARNHVVYHIHGSAGDKLRAILDFSRKNFG